MFEKEAEEYRKDLKSKFFLSEPQLDLACQGFKDGYNKANEWHYVKDELPPEDVPLLCMRGGNVYVAWFILGKWKGDKYNDVKKPYAWKEIVLPKESE